jgi:formylmethanofuran dehydrogenase subunit E
VTIRPEYLEHRSKGRIAVCPICAEAYPAMDGGICRSCQGESPYAERLGSHPGRECPAERQAPEGPRLRTVAAEDAVGEAALHDMTRIEPGASKGAEFRKGQVLSVGDVCRLQQMGRFRVYVEDEEGPGEDWVHEDAAAKAFAAAMAGEGVAPEGPPREGKVNLVARRDGLLVVDEARLQRFNLLPDVMAASRQNHQTVEQGTRVAGTRAIPLYLHKGTFQSAQGLLEGGPLVRVLPLRRLRVGILVTGNEVFQGLIEDKFEPIITGKVRQYGCEVARTLVVPDDREAIRKGVNELMEAGAELIVTTAGLSVDPDDVTRQGLLDAGLVDALYGAPVLPGAMTLLGRVNGVRVMGVPACALYFKTTSFDLLLPRVLAGLEITRNDLAALATGGMCMECKTCTYPKCPFGK